MSGNSTSRFVLQARDRHLLEALGTLRVLDREQAKLVAGFHSTTRANTRLLILTRGGLLTRTAVGTVRGGHKFLYALSRRGAQLIDVPYSGVLRTHTVLAGNLFLEHQLRLNEFYLQLCHRVRPETPVHVRVWRVFQHSISRTARLIPDAYVELENAMRTVTAFVEVDLGTESLRIWRQKTTGYLHLATSGEFAERFAPTQFRVLVIAPSVRRVEHIRRTVRALTSKIFWFTTFEECAGDRIWSSCWLRPTGTDRQPLL